jgi:hypothetical protein
MKKIKPFDYNNKKLQKKEFKKRNNIFSFFYEIYTNKKHSQSISSSFLN